MYVIVGRHILSVECDWRQLSSRDTGTSMYLREHAGHSLTSAVRHTLLVDSRDSREVVSPGFYFSTNQV